MFRRLRQWWRGWHLSLKSKLTLALSSIAVVLLLSSIISLLEYKRMSTYVSGIIADDIRNIEVAQSLLNAVDSYNLQILAVIGDDNLNTLPEIDQQQFVFRCDSLKSALSQKALVPLADSVMCAYSDYMLASMELQGELYSDDDTRIWYFERLQPIYGRLRTFIEELSAVMYDELRLNSADYDRGFYRSMIPSAVAVTVGILLIFLLMFFILVYYVTPLGKMVQGLENYKNIGKKYTCTFDGDDDLINLNEGIAELTEENRLLRRRIKDLKERTLGE